MVWRNVYLSKCVLVKYQKSRKIFDSAKIKMSTSVL